MQCRLLLLPPQNGQPALKAAILAAFHTEPCTRPHLCVHHLSTLVFWWCCQSVRRQRRQALRRLHLCKVLRLLPGAPATCSSCRHIPCSSRRLHLCPLQAHCRLEERGQLGGSVRIGVASLQRVPHPASGGRRTEGLPACLPHTQPKRGSNGVACATLTVLAARLPLQLAPAAAARGSPPAGMGANMQRWVDPCRRVLCCLTQRLPAA